jgi:ribosomal protein L11 methyltransferase
MDGSWLQAAVDCPQTEVADIEATFESLGALVTWAQGADDEEILEPEPGATPLWAAVRITALLPPDTPRERVTAAFPNYRPHFEVVADRDWDAEWRRSLQPLRFGRRLWVCPKGRACPDPAGISLTLEPGLAFGTGTHPTTAMCLAWLEGQPLADCRVLDYGCGSGILAIASLLLGAESAVAIDIDPQAIVATEQNAMRNRVDDRLVTFQSGEEDDRQYDILIANILAAPLIENAAAICTKLRVGGKLALSGILQSQADEVLKAYAGRIAFEPIRQLEDWVLLTGRRT